MGIIRRSGKISSKTSSTSNFQVEREPVLVLWFTNQQDSLTNMFADVAYRWHTECLGIQIDNKLDWNKHISTVAARGQSELAFLNRNLKGCPKKLRDTAYISLIRPALEYSCSVWHPHKKK